MPTHPQLPTLQPPLTAQTTMLTTLTMPMRRLTRWWQQVVAPWVRHLLAPVVTTRMRMRKRLTTTVLLLLLLRPRRRRQLVQLTTTVL